MNLIIKINNLKIIIIPKIKYIYKFYNYLIKISFLIEKIYNYFYHKKN